MRGKQRKGKGYGRTEVMGSYGRGGGRERKGKDGKGKTYE